MAEKLCIFICNTLAPEVSQLMLSGKYDDVKLMSFPAKCVGSPLNNEKIATLTSPIENQYSKIIFIVSACRSNKITNTLQNRKIEMIHLEQCFELILNREIIYHLIKQGYYLISSGWLKNYKHHINEWGFKEQTAKAFFRESVKKIMYLDTLESDEYVPKLNALSDYMGLPYEVLPVGLSHCRNFIDAIVSAWRADIERMNLNEKLSKFSKESADNYFIFRQLQNLVDYTDEDKIIKEIFSLLNILFAPQQISYQRKNIENEGDIICMNRTDVPFNTEKRNFLNIDIVHQNEVLGIINIYGIKFPEYIEQYRTIGTLISKIGGVAITNARKYKVIDDQKTQLVKLNSEKDKFFSIIAHDLKSPFNSILGFSELLQNTADKLSTHSISQYAGIIHSSAQHTFELLETLLEWARMQQGRFAFEPETLLLNDILETELALLKTNANQKNLELINDINKNTSIEADRKMMGTVLRNLISNAIKFTPRNGTIMVYAEVKDQLIEISVSDTGIGMTPETMKKLFRIETSFSTSGTADEEGTGLGLLLCSEFVEKHGGSISVESKVGIGSRFYFSIPLRNSGS